MTKVVTVLIAALCMAAGCNGQSSTAQVDTSAARGAAADQPKTDGISPSRHAEGVKETCPPPFVPDEATAIRIAEAVWLPIYGKGIYYSRPFRPELVKDVWIVAGSLPKDSQGGVPIAKISRDDGRVLQVVHTQ